MALEVEVYESPTDDSPLVFEDIDYVSMYNGGTHGPPALIAPSKGASAQASPRAVIGDEVLYINTQIVPMFKIERVS